jgi:minor curlin subunit
MQQISRAILLPSLGLLLMQCNFSLHAAELSPSLAAMLERQNLANLAQIQQRGQHNQLSLQQQHDENIALVWQFGIDNQADVLQSGLGNALILQQKGDENLATIIQRGHHNFLQLEQQGRASFSIEQIGDGGAVSVTQYE